MVLWGLAAAPARAADVTVAAGQEFTLPADVVLTGSDTFTAGDANGARCKILGGPMNFGFLADKDAGWKGALIIRNCDIVGVGNDSLEGFLLTVAGKGQVIIENSTLSICSDGLVLSIGSVGFTVSIVSIGSWASIGLCSQRHRAGQ